MFFHSLLLLLLVVLLAVQLCGASENLEVVPSGGNYLAHCTDCALHNATLTMGHLIWKPFYELVCNSCGERKEKSSLSKPVECVGGVNFEDGKLVCLRRTTHKAYDIIPGRYAMGRSACVWCRLTDDGELRCLCPNENSVYRLSTIQKVARCSKITREDGKLACLYPPTEENGGEGKKFDLVNRDNNQSSCLCSQNAREDEVNCWCREKGGNELKFYTLQNPLECSYGVGFENGALSCLHLSLDMVQGNFRSNCSRCSLSEDLGELSCWCVGDNGNQFTNFCTLRNPFECAAGVSYTSGELVCVPTSIDGKKKLTNLALPGGHYHSSCTTCTLSKARDKLSCMCLASRTWRVSAWSTLRSPSQCAIGVGNKGGTLVCLPSQTEDAQKKPVLAPQIEDVHESCTKCTLNQEQDELKCLCQKKKIWNTRSWSTLLNPFDCISGVSNENGNLVCLSTPDQENSVRVAFQAMLRSIFKLVNDVFDVIICFLRLIYAMVRSVLLFIAWILSKPVDWIVWSLKAPLASAGIFIVIVSCVFLAWSIQLRVCVLCKAEKEMFYQYYHHQSQGCECNAQHFYCREHFQRMTAANLREGKIRCMECGPGSAFVFTEKIIGEVAGADVLSNLVEAKVERAREEGERRGRDDSLPIVQGSTAHPRGRLAEVRKRFETIAILHCPRCKVPIVHGSGCAAVKCDSCQCGFCMFCLTDCGDNAHSHVQKCSLKPSKSSFGSEAEVVAANKKRITQNLADYWKSLTDPELKRLAASDPEIKAWLDEYKIV